MTVLLCRRDDLGSGGTGTEVFAEDAHPWRIRPHHRFRSPATGLLAFGVGMTTSPCRTDGLKGGVTGSEGTGRPLITSGTAVRRAIDLPNGRPFSWQIVAGALDAVQRRFVHRFNREEPRQPALAYVRRLVTLLGRKNGWTLVVRPDTVVRPASTGCRTETSGTSTWPRTTCATTPISWGPRRSAAERRAVRPQRRNGTLRPRTRSKPSALGSSPRSQAVARPCGRR